MLKYFIENLDKIASSPYSLVGYALALGAWTFTYFRSKRLKLISAVIYSLPEADRKEVLLREYNIVPKRGITAEQWLRSRKQFFMLLSFISLLIVIAIIVLVTIPTKKNQDKMMKIVSPLGTGIYPGISIEAANQIQKVLKLSCDFRATEYQQPIMYSYWNLGDFPLHQWNTLFGEQVSGFLTFCKSDKIFRISFRYMDNEQQINRAFSNFQSTYDIEPQHFSEYSIAQISNEKYRAVAVKSYASIHNTYMTEITFEELNSPTFAKRRW